MIRSGLYMTGKASVLNLFMESGICISVGIARLHHAHGMVSLTSKVLLCPGCQPRGHVDRLRCTDSASQQLCGHHCSA